MSTAVMEAAERLRLAAESRMPCMPVRDLIGAHDVAAAYAVQELNVRDWIDRCGGPKAARC
jgi:2-keto-4-pentenoate hydratase